MPDTRGICIFVALLQLSFLRFAATCRIHRSTSHICSSSLQQAHTPTYCTNTHTHTGDTNTHLKFRPHRCCVCSKWPEFLSMWTHTVWQPEHTVSANATDTHPWLTSTCMHKYRTAEWLLTTFDEMVVRHFLSKSDSQVGRKAGRQKGMQGSQWVRKAGR